MKACLYVITFHGREKMRSDTVQTVILIRYSSKHLQINRDWGERGYWGHRAVTNETSYHLPELGCRQTISYSCSGLLSYPYLEYQTDLALPCTSGIPGLHVSPSRGWCGERALGLAATQMCQLNVIPNSKKRKQKVLHGGGHKFDLKRHRLYVAPISILLWALLAFKNLSNSVIL